MICKPRNHIALLAAGALIGLGACGTQPTDWTEEAGFRWRALTPIGRPAGLREMAPERTGITFSNRVSDTRRIESPNTLVGAGVALGDVDGDGRVDVYLASTDGPNALYRNLGGWQFEERASTAGVAADGRASTGAVLVDVDGDADLDLFLTALGGPNGLFINDGTGSFTEETAARGLVSTAGSTTATLADIDADGDLDLYVANYKARHAEDLFHPNERAFDRVVYQEDGEWRIAPRFEDHYRVRVLEEHDIVVRVERGEPDQLFLNDGTGHFEAASWTDGRFLDEDGHRLAEIPDRFALAARFYDIDDDGDVDLYVCNDFEDPDFFWINDGTGTFQAIERLAVRAASNAAMAVDFADIDRNGTADFFVADMRSRSREGLLRRIPSHTALPKLVGKIEDRPQLQRNTMFLNRGDATFAQVAEYAGVEASGWTWSTMFVDVDLDGYQDILGGNGHIWDVQDADSDNRVRQMRGSNWREAILLYPPLHQRNPAFRNNGDSTFSPAGETWGYGREADVSHGLAAGDLDGDGDLDIVVNRVDRPAAVYRNDSRSPRIAVRLLGAAPNTDAVGATVHLHGGSLPTQEHQITAGGLYLSSSDRAIGFAADPRAQHVIEVDWPKGGRTRITGVRANRLYEIREPAASTPQPSLPSGTPDTTSPTLFTDVSASVDYEHHESDFDDYQRQPLLPSMLSRLGPGLTWHDVDGDGAEDLLVPSGAGARSHVLLNGTSRFVARPIGPVAPDDLTSIIPLPLDSGRLALVVAQSRYESDSTRPVAWILELSRPGQRSSVVPLPAAGGGSPGPMAAADVDSDGDLDLFIGARSTPGRFPVTAHSWLLFNDDGVLAPSAASQTLADLGNVSDAVFTDIDGDGDPDLVIARDLGRLGVMRNDGGTFSDATEYWGLPADVSRWNGVTAGDFDGDGRMDLIATSWGRNTPWRTSADTPLRIYHGDFDADGTYDLIEAVPDEAGESDLVLTPFQAIRVALPSVAFRASTFEEYVNTPVTDLVGTPAAQAISITTLTHVMLLNRGDRFLAHPLSSAAQLAPAFGIVVADVDADGHEDAFLAQNFFATARDLPRLDAGRGLLLLGDGTGVLSPVLGSESGITVYGEQRGAAAADFDGDGRVDLAVAQNGAPLRLFRNTSTRTGLSVRLRGPDRNPHGVGAMIRLVGSRGMGPAREVRLGGGYWSVSAATQIMGRPEGLRAVWVRWPDGRAVEYPLTPTDAAVTLRYDQGSPSR